MNLLSVLQIINYTFVLFFGIVASLYLADIPFPDNKRLYLLTLSGFGIVQLLFFFCSGADLLYKSYPFLIHIPLILPIRFALHRSLHLSLIAVLSAYLLCTPRKWFGTLLSFFADYDPKVANLATFLITLPLLWFVIRYIAPHIVQLQYESRSVLTLFSVLLLFYYILEYTLTVYTNLLYTAAPAVVETVDSFIVLLYFILTMTSLDFSRQKTKAEHQSMLLHTAAIQAQKEIAQLSLMEKQAAIYRHDLRHHMNFLKTCISENKNDTALAYIQEIHEDMERSTLIRYCRDEAINLILSSYAAKAAAKDISIRIEVTASDFSRFQIIDLCSLLANGLENAISACSKIPQQADTAKPDEHFPHQPPRPERSIRLNIFEKNERLCIHLSNGCARMPLFRNELPISAEAGHGIGTKSMVSVIEKYSGIYRFSASGNTFTFQATI